MKHCRSTASPCTVPCVLGLSLLDSNTVAPQSMESCRRAVGGVKEIRTFVTGTAKTRQRSCVSSVWSSSTDSAQTSEIDHWRVSECSRPVCETAGCGSAADDEGSARLVAAHFSMEHMVQHLRQGTKTASNASSTTTRTTRPPVGTMVQFSSGLGEALKTHGVAAELWSDFHKGARSVIVERHLRQLLWRVRKGTVMW